MRSIVAGSSMRDHAQLPAAALRLYLLTDEQDSALPFIEPVG
jgi:hypothetical protein